MIETSELRAGDKGYYGDTEGFWVVIAVTTNWVHLETPDGTDVMPIPRGEAADQNWAWYRDPEPVGVTLPAGLALVDFETRKVATPAGTTHANGEALKTRWQIFAAGVAIGDQIHVLHGDDEEKLLAEIGALLAGATEVGYFATREFDEMVARGRFTNARRAHAPAPYYPAVPGAEELPWRNIRRSNERFPERPGTQVASKDVPAAWKAGRRQEVLDHLRWDIETLRDLWLNR